MISIFSMTKLWSPYRRCMIMTFDVLRLYPRCQIIVIVLLAWIIKVVTGASLRTYAVRTVLKRILRFLIVNNALVCVSHFNFVFLNCSCENIRISFVVDTLICSVLNVKTGLDKVEPNVGWWLGNETLIVSGVGFGSDFQYRCSFGGDRTTSAQFLSETNITCLTSTTRFVSCFNLFESYPLIGTHTHKQ